jgi:hypothetical protein
VKWYAESLVTVPDGGAEEAGKMRGKKAADVIIANYVYSPGVGENDD